MALRPMASDPRLLDTPEKIADAGERLYAERHKAGLEAANRGEFVAIDVLAGSVYVARFPEEALTEARAKAPGGIFHLIRIGAPSAYRSTAIRPIHGFWTGLPRLAR